MIKKSFFSFGFILILFLSSTHAAPANAAQYKPILLPYIKFNVTQNYLVGGSYDQNRPMTNFTNYLRGSTYALSGNKTLIAYFTTLPNNSSIYIGKNLTPAAFAKFAKTCPSIGNDPNKIVCTLTVTSDTNAKGSLPVILVNGLRAYSIDEVISNRFNSANGTVITTAPYYREISATPADFQHATPNQPVTVTALSHYFSSPDQLESFSLNATQVGGSGARCPVKLITGINAASCAAANTFAIDTKGNLNATGPLSVGIYQINVLAEETFNSVTEQAWQTFYLNVNTNNPNLSAWRAGAVASTNVISSYPSIYLYSSQDPDKSGSGWPSDYQNYASDLGTINGNYLHTNPVKSVFVEIIDVLYANGLNYWELQANANPEMQIMSAGITNNRPTLGTWINQLINPFGQKNIGVTLNYTFDQKVKLDFISYNDLQQNYLVNEIIGPINQYNLDGVAMDLEGGFSQPNVAEFYKKLADTLAYNGKWFSYYYFADMFNPNIIASFGPLGVANISTYDVGQYRAPETTSSNNLPSTISYQAGGFTSAQATAIYTGFGNDSTCSTLHGQYYQPVSYCNLSINDAYSENNRRFYENYHAVSTHDAIVYFNGKYQLTLPLADSATEWNAVEMWNPDFTPAVFKTGRLMTNANACTLISNSYIKANEQALETNPASAAYINLQTCLLNTVANNVGTLPLQTFSQCGPSIPYYQCILVSSLPGSQTIGQPGLIRSNVIDYVRNNIAVYKDTNPAHAVGYSIFALENPAAAPSGAFGVDVTTPNITVQEPWYLGYNYANNPDPYYNIALINQIWQQFGAINMSLSSKQ